MSAIIAGYFMSRLATLCVFFVTGLSCGTYSIWSGSDANADLINYHFYNVYRSLSNRYICDFLSPIYSREQARDFKAIFRIPKFFVNKLERKIQAVQKLLGGGHNVGHVRALVQNAK